MSKKVYILAITIIIFLLGGTGLFYILFSESKPIQIPFEDEEITSNGYAMENFCISNKYSKAYGTYTENERRDSKLYEFKRNGEKYVDPKEIEIPDDMKCLTVNLLENEDKVYMTLQKKNYNNKEEGKYKIACTSLDDFEDSKCDSLNFIDKLNSGDGNVIFSTDNKGNVLYINISGSNINLKYMENNNGEYVNESTIMDGKSCRGATLSPDGENMIVSDASDGNDESVCNLFLLKKSGDAWDKPELLGTINDGIEDKIYPLISNDGNELIYLSHTSYTIYNSEKTKVKCSAYKADLKSVLENTRKYNDEANKKKEETHKYDTAKFDLELRNKSDM